jgi:hypothetical protein
VMMSSFPMFGLVSYLVVSFAALQYDLRSSYGYFRDYC